MSDTQQPNRPMGATTMRDLATISDARHAEQRRRVEQYNVEELYRARCAAAHGWARKMAGDNARRADRPAVVIVNTARKVVGR